VPAHSRRSFWPVSCRCTFALACRAGYLFPPPALPGFDGHTTMSDPARAAASRDVEADTVTQDGSPRGLLRLHSRTAHRIAQPPKATFVTRLQPSRSPGRAARQLPDQSTTLWVDSSSTGDSRLRGALPTLEPSWVLTVDKALGWFGSAV
jgi:hypothetical protein